MGTTENYSESCGGTAATGGTATTAPSPGCSAYHSLSLSAMARIVSFFPDGVPLGFVAASPMARLAAETYRAEENYRWCATGMVRREPGERETFDTYEARRQRRAGVQLGRLITVYHDCVGRMPRCTQPSLPTQMEVSVDAAVDSWRSGQQYKKAAGVGLLAEEWHAKPLVMTPGADRETADVFEPVAASGGNLLNSDSNPKDRLPGHGGTTVASGARGGPSSSLLAPNGGNTNTHDINSAALQEWLPESAAAAKDCCEGEDTAVRAFPPPTTICLEDGHRVFYFTGPNRRTVYLWMDTPVRSSTLHVPDMGNDEESPQYGVTEEANRDSCLREELHELVRRSRWWFQRPAVSSMRYLAEVYGKDSTLLPPPPPAIYLHVYGQSAESIPVVCELLLTAPPPPPPPTTSSAATRAGGDGGGGDDPAAGGYGASPLPSPSSSTASCSFRPGGLGGYTVASPLPAVAVAQHELKNHQLERLFGNRRSPWLSVHGAMLAGPAPGNALAHTIRPPPPLPPPHILSHVTMPVLEGLFVVGYPLMSMQLIAHASSSAAAAYERLHLPPSARGEGSAGAAAGLRLGQSVLDAVTAGGIHHHDGHATMTNNNNNGDPAASAGPLPTWLSEHELLSGNTGERSPPETSSPGRSGAGGNAPTAPPSPHSAASSVTSNLFGITVGLSATAPCALKREWTNRLRILKFHGVRFDDDGLRTFIGATTTTGTNHHNNADEQSDWDKEQGEEFDTRAGRGHSGRHSRHHHHSSSVSGVNNCSTQALHDGISGHHGRRHTGGTTDSSRPLTGRSVETTGTTVMDSPRAPSTLLSLRGGNTYKVALNPVMPFLEVCDIALSLELTVFPLLSKEGQSAEDHVVYSGIRLLPVISLRHLTLLHLQGTGIQQAVLDLIGLSCPALESLYLGSCPFLHNVEPLGLLPVLRRLDMHGTALTDEGLDGVLSPWSFPALEELSLAGCTGIHNVSALGHLKTLRLLDLRQVPIREGLAELRGCPRLEKLFFSSSLQLAAQMEHRQPEWVKPIFLHHLHTLAHLTLENIPLFSHEGIEALAKARTGLRTLRLLHMLRLDSVAALRHVPTLETLHIEDAPLLMADGLEGIGVHCPKLQSVQLLGCTLLEGLEGLAGARQLRYVEFVNGRDNVSTELLRGLLRVVDCRQSGRARHLLVTPRQREPPQQPGSHHPDGGNAEGDITKALDCITAAADATPAVNTSSSSSSGTACCSFPPLEILRIPGYAQLDSLQPLVECASSLSGLKVLDVSGSALDNVAIEQLATVSTMTMTTTTSSNASTVSATRREQTTIIGSEQAEGDTPVSTATAASLNALYLRGCKRLTKVNALMHLPVLRVLDLSESAVSDGGIGSLKAAPALEVLLLRNCEAMQFLPHTGAFERLRVLYLSDNRRLNSRLLKQFFSFVDDCEEKLANPLDTPFRRLEELHLDGTAIDTLRPLVMLQHLRVLNVSGTALRPAGIVHLSEMRRLHVLNVSHIQKQYMAGGSLRPLFTHPSLQQLDLRGTTLDTSPAGAAAVALPVAVLAVSPIRELALSGRTQLPLLLPLLQHPNALPQLRRLVVEDGDYLTSDVGETAAAAALPPPVAGLALPNSTALKQEALRTHLDRSRLAAHRRAGGLTFAPAPEIEDHHSSTEEDHHHHHHNNNSAAAELMDPRGTLPSDTDVTGMAETAAGRTPSSHTAAGFPCLPGESVEERLQRLHYCLSMISAARPLTSVRREMPSE